MRRLSRWGQPDQVEICVAALIISLLAISAIECYTQTSYPGYSASPPARRTPRSSGSIARHTNWFTSFSTGTLSFRSKTSGHCSLLMNSLIPGWFVNTETEYYAKRRRLPSRYTPHDNAAHAHAHHSARSYLPCTLCGSSSIRDPRWAGRSVAWMTVGDSRITP